MLQLFAIYLPHITEEIYQNTFKNTQNEISIHKFNIGKIDVDFDEKIIEKGDAVVNIISSVRQFKSENKLSLKTEIKSIEITNEDVEFISSCIDDIKAVTSTQNIKLNQGNFDIKIGEIISDNK